jgi:hypothetical protein
MLVNFSRNPDPTSTAGDQERRFYGRETMARYEVTLHDALPFMRRKAARDIATALLVTVVAGGMALVSGAGEPASLTMFGLGMGIAIGVLVDSYREYDRMKEMYGPEVGTIEVSVEPERILFASDVSQTIIFRTPKVTVAESHGAFLITIGKGMAPSLLPVRHLTPDEIHLLRDWAKK